MLFNSIPFLFAFLPLALAGFFFFARHSREKAAAWLCIASLVFYSWENPFRLLAIIFFSIGFNFLIGARLARRPNKWLLAVGIAGNLLLLGYFKYAGFFLENISALTGFSMTIPAIILPLGISFYTFTQIAFLVDAFRGNAREYQPLHYVLFVTFFPHLIAGPIIHHKGIMPQFERRETYRFNAANFALGLAWFSTGLFKKVMLADNVGAYVAPVFSPISNAFAPGFADAWLGALAFTLQLYFDFSGYSDMAIGLALLFNIRLPINFNSPYQAISMIEFWRRWHITLSHFLRDYLYIPLGGNRKGRVRRNVNVMITMLLGGLWHGASWNFVLWGGLHGAGLTLNHWWKDFVGWRVPAWLGWALVMLLAVIAWVPFRAATLSETFALWRLMFHKPSLTLHAVNRGAVEWVTALSAIALFLPNTQAIMLTRWKPNRRWALAAGAALGASVGAIISGGASEFLYFRF